MSQYFPGQPGPPPGDLSYLIQGTRGQVNTYLIKARARQRRLLTLAVLAGALATLFAGAPAVGGRHSPTRWPQHSVSHRRYGSCCVPLPHSVRWRPPFLLSC